MTELQLKIITLREEGLTYRAIQIKLGNPSKKLIKDTLNTFRPELSGNVVDNPGKR
jgi:hypothetical protein